MIKIPGYEIIGYRLPKKGEQYVGNGPDIIITAKVDHIGSSPWRIIVRKEWEWPAWLTATHIAMDSDGEWYAFEDLPELQGASWDSANNSYISGEMFAIQMPVCDDYTQSLRKNPHVS